MTSPIKQVAWLVTQPPMGADCHGRRRPREAMRGQSICLLGFRNESRNVKPGNQHPAVQPSMLLRPLLRREISRYKSSVKMEDLSMLHCGNEKHLSCYSVTTGDDMDKGRKKFFVFKSIFPLHFAIWMPFRPAFKAH